MKFNKATQVIEKKQVITFDVFDTLINRFVDRPEDIFKYVEKDLIVTIKTVIFLF